MKSHVTIALAGFGTVGGGTFQLLKDHAADVIARVGAPVKVKWIVSHNKPTPKELEGGIRHTTNWKKIVEDPDIDCVVELMGGTEPALSLVLASLKAGKHIITANKAILSKHWDEIHNTADQSGRLVYFEAAVGGGVPLVQALNEGLAGNRIRKITGILNGTTNYILTRMQEAGLTYSDALKEAQAAGYAEKDPTFDVEGVDAAQKLSILASIATGFWVRPDQVHCEGITHLQSFDLRVIQERLASTVKLLAIAKSTESGWICRVHPTLVPKMHPFANVRNEYNAVTFHGNATGDVMLYGKGAGRFPTSSAVLSDIMFLCRQIANGTAGELPYVCRSRHRKPLIADFSKVVSRYYIRVTTKDRPGVLSKVTGILGRHNVSIASVYQDTFEDAAARRHSVPIVLLTHKTQEANVAASVRAINALPSTRAKTVILRLL